MRIFIQALKSFRRNILLNESIRKLFYYRSRLQSNVSLSPLEDTNGNLIENNFGRVKVYNAFFQIIYINDHGDFPAFINRTDVIMPSFAFAIDNYQEDSHCFK